MMPSQTPASPSLARFPALAALAAFIFLLALAPLPLAAEPSPPGGPPPYRPDWAFEGMSPELEALRAEAEALSDGSRHGEAAEAWRTLAAASESAYGAGDPRTLAALSRMARETEEDLSADPGGARDAARRAEAGLAAALGADSPETLFAYETAAWFALDAGEAQWANEAFTEIVGRAAESLGPYHPLALHSRYGLGAALLRAGNARAAAETLRETSEAAEKALPPGHQIALHARNGLALALSSLGETAAAADILRGALETCERTLGPEHPETLTYMNNLAHALNGLGDFASARDMHRKVLEASRRTLGPEHPDTLASINNLALALAGLGDYAAARGLHEEALEARRRILGPEHPDTLTSINNLAASQADLGDFAAARDMHREALEARRRTLSSEHPDTLISMNNLAHTLIRLGDYAAGRDLHREALESNKRTLGPEHPDTLISMNNLAYALASLGDFAAARDMLSRALESETRVLGPDHPSTAITAANLGTVHDRLGSPEEAAFYLKLSVRSAQKARAALSALEPELRRSWLATVEDRYRRLYDVLMRLGRAAEAMAVLDLLKKDELRGLDPEGAPEGAARDLFADTPEEAAWKRYSGAAEPLAALGLERVRLAEKRGREGLAAEEEARLAELDGLLETAAATFLDACEGLRDVLGGPEGEAAARAAEELRSRQETLAGMGEGTVLAHAVSAPDRLYLMLVTPHALVSLESPVGRDDLGRLAEEFGAALRNPAADPRPAGKKLYDAVFAPLEPELEAAGARTVMLSLDGALRYVPMAALWDGERWLAEKYPTALYTLSTADKLRTPPPEGPASARALGVTAAWRGFPALPGVAAEIASIVRPAGQAGKAAAGAAAKAGGGQAGTATEAGAIPAAGVLEGEALLDGDFDRQALSLSLASDAPVVHIASHFRLSPAGHEATELLLGDGSTLTLRKIKTDPSLDFKGLDLLTLSACDTASGAGRDGKEVESFGEVVQRAGASAVLASLWPVSDASTALLMREFYRLRYVEGRNKAEALREAQLSVMAGSPAGPAAAGRAAISAAGASSAAGPAGAAPQSAPAWTERGFSHPFYWAPFILMGNWR